MSYNTKPMLKVLLPDSCSVCLPTVAHVDMVVIVFHFLGSMFYILRLKFNKDLIIIGSLVSRSCTAGYPGLQEKILAHS